MYKCTAGGNNVILDTSPLNTGLGNETERFQSNLPLLSFRFIAQTSTKRRLLYLKTQFVPRSTHFPSGL
jgi:hypothetical protein